MTSLNRSIDICIIYGDQEKYTKISNAEANMDSIHWCVRNLFGILVPKSYFIKVYNIEIKDFIILNQNELDYGYNPFKRYFSADDFERMFAFVNLYIAEYSAVNCETNTQTSLLCQETTFPNANDSSTLVMNEQECQQDASLNNSTTNNNTSPLSDSLDKLLVYEQMNIGDEQVNIDLLINNNTPDDHPATEASAENVVLTQNNLLIATQNDNICRDLGEPTEVQNVELNRLDFSLDVKPTQKPIYKSDRFNQKTKNETNGHITRIQGIKTGKPAKSSVLPRIHIPQLYQNKPNLWLDTYVVSEKSQDKKRHWMKHRDKGFLPKKYTNATSPINPISFALNETRLTNEGDLELILPMTTMWNKSELLDEEVDEVYQLDERAAIDLHRAAYEPSSPRLLCVLRQNNATIWETTCLSDYMRSTKTRKRDLTNINTAALDNAPTCKKARTK